MAGHSKWANIKHKKAKEDAKRSKIFTKIIRELTVAAREGGGDPDANPRLSLAVDNAKQANMPKDTMERAIKKGTGELDDGSQIEEVTYEGYGPGGIAYFVEATTDNLNRTVSEIRHAFDKFGGNLGQNGSVAYMFNQKGSIIIPNPEDSIDDEELMLQAIDAGAEDITNEDEHFEIITSREELFDVRKNIEEEGYNIESASLVRIPTTNTKVDADTALSNFKLMDILEENDDVSEVYNNMEMDEETLEVAQNM
jgi:YebC/PmpR family DNA-binding regulatory protein